MKAEIKLTGKELQEIIAEYVAKKTGHTVNKVDLTVKTNYDDRPGGYSYSVFDAAIVSIEVIG